MLSIDLILFNLINGLSGKHIWLDTLAVFGADSLGYILIGCLIILLAINTRKYWPVIWRSVLAVVISRLFLTEIIRFLWPRPRPFIAESVNLLIEKNPTPSFPSGHAAFYFALSFVLFFYNKKIGLFFLIATLLMTISRIFVGIHWPLDILAGAVVGLISAFLVTRFLK